MTPGPDTPVAVIGMSCRAAGVETLAELWDVQRRAEQRFGPVPPGRWYGLDPGLASSPRAALLDRIDQFDARFFDIAPRMAAWMDPQHRLLLELAWHAVENAGLDPDALAGAPVAVLVGAFTADYRERMNAAGRCDSAAFPGTLASFLANRVSYQFGWTGPSLVVDSACSSGLTALGLAVRGLQHGDYPMALVGAPSVISAGFYANTAYRGGALSLSGRSVPFSAGRNGYLRGEGGACLLLKPLPQAVRDGDPVHAVIRAVGTAHNGRGGGLTGTDPDAQVQLIRRTAAAAGCAVADLGYLEAHGTATTGGDAIEVAALAAALGGGAVSPAGPGGRLWVGSIKANIGHLEAAAGLIGLVSAVLVLRNGRIPAVAGLTEVDPRLPIGDAPVAVAVSEVPWPAGPAPRRAGVNSFGLGGAMSHVVVEQPPARPDPPATGGRQAVPLSAPDGVSLAGLAGRLLHELAGTDPPDLAAVAWTLQTGRRARPCRVVLAAADLDELRAGLRGVAAGRPGRSTCDGLEDGVARLASAWLDGATVDWRALWRGRRPPARAALPGSPFNRRSYWFDQDIPAAAGG